MLRVAGAALGLEEADALLDFRRRVVARAEDGAQALAQRLGLPVEHAGLELAEHAQRREERQHLRSVEPETRQFVARAGARLAKTVAVRLAVVVDRRIEAVAHIGEIALDASGRHAQLFLEIDEGDGPAL